jgi:hypothetical protein
MNYNQYRNSGGWGTNQYQFPAPLAPSFQPQPSWGGMDYFRAHAASPDMSLYDHAWNRVRNYSGSGGLGIGQNEARHWHRRAYGGLGNATQMLPEELGHAAAYEAYRTWMHNSSMYEPLSGDLERQREALIGLAIAEATRLLAFSGRSRDGYSRTEACETAAATASVIFAQNRGMDMDGGYRGRSRAGSFSGSYDGSYRSGSSYRGTSPFPSGGTGSTYGDPYAYDDSIMRPHHHHRHSRSHSRSRRHSSSSHHRPIVVTTAPQYGAGYGTSPMAIPGSAVASSSYGTYGSYAGYGGGVSPYGQAPAPIYTGSSMPSYGGYASTVAPGTLVVPSPRSHRHSISGSHHDDHRRPRSASGYTYGY